MPPPNLPENLVLYPVQPAPLPKNYHFTIGFRAGWQPPRKDLIQLFFNGSTQGHLLKQQDEPGTLGFNTLLANLLSQVAFDQLWGQTITCQAFALGADGLSYVAKSNLQTLALPVLPCTLTHQYNLFAAEGDTPAPTAHAAPQGRRLYYRCQPSGVPSALPTGYYVRTDTLRLEDNPACRGFDRFSFWLSAYAVCLKNAGAVSTGEQLAQALKAQSCRWVPHSAPLSAINAALQSHLDPSTLPALMWTAQRVVCLQTLNQPAVMAMEFDTAGWHKTRFSTWLANEAQDTVWNFRHLSVPAMPPPVWGPAGLP